MTSKETTKKLTRFISNDFPHINSVLVTKGEETIFEQYYNRYSPHRLQRTACMFKGFISATVGVVLKQGLIASVDEKIVDIFGAQLQDGIDPRMSRITWEHCLTKSTGLSGYPRNVDETEESVDGFEMLAGLEVAHEPGTVFEYKPDPQILVYAIEQLSGESFAEDMDRNLMTPLGISDYRWDSSYENIEQMEMRVQDIAKLGRLYLNEGVWEDTTLISRSYIEASTTEYIDGGFPEEKGYGYLWWVDTYRGHKIYFSSGFGGQYLFVIPEHDMTVTITSQMDRPHRENRAVFRHVMELML